MSRILTWQVVLFMLLLLACAQAGLAMDGPGWWKDAEVEGRRYGFMIVDDDSLAEMLKASLPPLLLDVRADYEYEGGHIPGAVNLEFDLSEEQYITREKEQALRALLGPDLTRPVVIYCRSFR
ncbi:rhodanese-like domain-containing protein [Maridesulfovibrio sp. FT414]